jgi:molybdopterin-biosynthesis enzyme MoeA-like protein
MLSESVRANAREGDVGTALRAIQARHPDTIIGSYPFLDENGQPNTSLVVRSRDADKLYAALAEVEAMLVALHKPAV